MLLMSTPKNILEQYCNIMQEIADLDRKIKEGHKKLRKLEKEIVCDVVMGSRDDLRYGTIKIEGAPQREISRQWELIHSRTEKMQSSKRKLDEMTVEVEEYIQTIPDSELRRIARFRYEDNLEWRQVAAQMGRGYTDDSCRQKLARYMKRAKE